MERARTLTFPKFLDERFKPRRIGFKISSDRYFPLKVRRHLGAHHIDRQAPFRRDTAYALFVLTAAVLGHKGTHLSVLALSKGPSKNKRPNSSPNPHWKRAGN